MDDREIPPLISALAACMCLALGMACAAAPPEEEPAPQVDPAEANLAALNELRAKYLQAVNRGDADGLAVLYTEDGIRIGANSRPIEGRDNIRLFAAADYADTHWNMQLRVDEAEYSGDLAFVRGTYALSLSSKEDPDTVTYQEVGKWMDLMRRQEDGSWLIERELANRDHPPGEAPEVSDDA